MSSLPISSVCFVCTVMEVCTAKVEAVENWPNPASWPAWPGERAGGTIICTVMGGLYRLPWRSVSPALPKSCSVVASAWQSHLLLLRVLDTQSTIVTPRDTPFGPWLFPRSSIKERWVHLNQAHFKLQQIRKKHATELRWVFGEMARSGRTF
jgi:hypothetical protein